MCNHELKRLFYTKDADYDIQTCRVDSENGKDKYTLCYCEKCGQVFVMEIAKKMCETLNESNKELTVNEVAKFWKTVKDMDANSLDKIFGEMNFWTILNSIPYQEAKAKYEAWKAEREQICVGDEVALQNGNFKYVVMGFHFNTAYLLASDGSISKFPVNKLKKLNRHFNETEELLKKMKEDKE